MQFTTRGNGNVQSHDKEESKSNNTITANSGAHTLTHDQIIKKSPFNKNKGEPIVTPSTYLQSLQISREDKTFTTSVYRKPTFSGGYTHFDSFLPSTYSLVLFAHSLTVAYEFAQAGLNYTMNQFA